MSPFVAPEGAPVTLGIVGQRRTLLAMLEPAAAVAPNKDFVPVLKHVLISADAAGVRISGTDTTVAVITRTHVGPTLAVSTPGEALLPAAVLVDVLRAADGSADVQCSLMVQGEKATIRVGQTFWTLALPVSAQDFPALPDLATLTWVGLVRTEFMGAVKAVQGVAARESLRPSLMIVDVANGKMRASDGVRVHQIAVPFPDMQVPIAAVDGLLKMLGASDKGGMAVSSTEQAVIFTCHSEVGTVAFIAQRPHAAFPDIEAALLKPAMSNNLPWSVDRDALMGAVKRVRITADPATSAVSLTLSEGFCTVASMDKVGSHTEEVLTCTWGRLPREMTFNHAHLLDLLSTAAPGPVEFFLGKDVKSRPSVLLMKHAERGQFAILNQTRADWLRRA